MNKMQKEYLKKLFIGIGLFLWAVAIIVSATLGEPWHWFAIGSTSVIAIPMLFIILYVPIATQVWHWRLMGICNAETEEELLRDWWFWIRRSDTWADYIAQDILENYTDTSSKTEAEDFLRRLAEVKKPKWL